ncbi:SCO family protein [Radiobacillus deserti]|uniref:SCO family protein n=1 Tax=Radiobacillus deserti TaxID=2594883 RepID=A0A516KDY5_9BACI|nr:SCO family protein [Radiobacillus deserti]QDP39615.1 SCO family protein [Radiobacillus deserti]
MKRKLTISLFFILTALFITACGDKTIPDRLDWKVQDFEATDQNGETVSLEDLKGKVWIADFVFTSCTTVCPPMTANMARLQKKLKEEDVPVQIVSFSVDPERDTPEIRSEYVTARGGDLSTWFFLGDYSFDYVKNLSEGSFKSAVAEPTAGTDQFTHGTRFYLIDQEGTIVKYYSGYKEVPYEEIVEHAKILTENQE